MAGIDGHVTSLRTALSPKSPFDKSPFGSQGNTAGKYISILRISRYRTSKGLRPAPYALSVDAVGQRPRSAGRIAGQCDSVHRPGEAVVVVDRIVHGAAVVPQGERTDAPPEATRELRPHRMLEQIAQQRAALVLGHVDEAGGVRDVDVQRFAAGFGMRTNDGMYRLELAVVARARVANAVFA